MKYLKIATVRRARMTGYQKKNRVLKGNVYLQKEWLGKRVAVILKKDYLALNRSYRLLKTQVRNSIRLLKKQETI